MRCKYTDVDFLFDRPFELLNTARVEADLHTSMEPEYKSLYRSSRAGAGAPMHVCPELQFRHGDGVPNLRFK